MGLHGRQLGGVPLMPLRTQLPTLPGHFNRRKDDRDDRRRDQQRGPQTQRKAPQRMRQRFLSRTHELDALGDKAHEDDQRQNPRQRQHVERKYRRPNQRPLRQIAQRHHLRLAVRPQDRRNIGVRQRLAQLLCASIHLLQQVCPQFGERVVLHSRRQILPYSLQITFE